MEFSHCEGGEDEVDVDTEIANMRKKLESARKSEHTKAAVGKMMRKPAAAPIDKRPAATIDKRPAGSVIKRPGSASDGPDQPELGSRFDAIVYKGCKIYWGGDRRYRVLTQPKTATTNFSWQSEDDAPSVWSSVLACCEANAK